MKISELQEILEQYKQKNGDMEVRLVTETPCTSTNNSLTDADIKLSLKYSTNESDINELIKITRSAWLTGSIENTIDKLKEKGLATHYLNICQYIE